MPSTTRPEVRTLPRRAAAVRVVVAVKEWASSGHAVFGRSPNVRMTPPREMRRSKGRMKPGVEFLPAVANLHFGDSTIPRINLAEVVVVAVDLRIQPPPRPPRPFWDRIMGRNPPRKSSTQVQGVEMGTAVGMVVVISSLKMRPTPRPRTVMAAVAVTVADVKEIAAPRFPNDSLRRTRSHFLPPPAQLIKWIKRRQVVTIRLHGHLPNLGRGVL